MTIKDLPATMRPREKLLARGAAALGDAELLALLLRTGLKGTGVLQLAERLLAEFGGIAGLLNASSDDLKRVKGTIERRASSSTAASSARLAGPMSAVAR
jgi:DNA repair protein RadC